MFKLFVVDRYNDELFALRIVTWNCDCLQKMIIIVIIIIIYFKPYNFTNFSYMWGLKHWAWIVDIK